MQKCVLILAFALLLLMPLRFAQQNPEENKIKLTKMEVNYTEIKDKYGYPIGAKITTSIIAYSTNTKEDRDPNNNQEKKEGSNPISEGSARMDVKYLKDAEIRVTALKDAQESLLCVITTDQHGIIVIPKIDPTTGNIIYTSTDLYYGECEVIWPGELKDSCFRVHLYYDGGSEGDYYYKPTSSAFVACQGKGGFGNVLTDKLNEVIIQETIKNPNLFCIPSLILFGLLVAGLYTRGLTLFGIMDVLTPKPPKTPEIKYSYANYSPHSSQKDELTKAVAHMEKVLLPAALRRLLRNKGYSVKEIMKYRKRMVPEEILRVLGRKLKIREIEGILNNRNKDYAERMSEAAALIRKKYHHDEEVNALLDLIAVYDSYRGVLGKYSERKKISGPFKGTKKAIDSFAKPFEWMKLIPGQGSKKLADFLNERAIVKPLKMVTHGLSDSFWGITRNAKASYVLRMSPLLMHSRTRRKIRQNRIKLQGKINTMPDSKIYKNPIKWAKKAATKTALLALGGEETVIGRAMNPEKHAAYQNVQLTKAVTTEALSLKIMEMIEEVARNRKTVKSVEELNKSDPLVKLLMNEGNRGEELVKRYNKIVENPIELLTYFENPIAHPNREISGGIVGSENPEVFLENIEKILSSGILDEISKNPEYNKLLEAARVMNEKYETLLKEISVAFSSYDAGERSTPREEIIKSLKDQLGEIDKLMDNILNSDVWENSTLNRRREKIAEMWNAIKENIINGDFSTISERYVKAETSIYSILKESSALGIEFSLMRDKSGFSYGVAHTAEDRLIISREKMASNLDSFFTNFFETTVAKTEDGILLPRDPNSKEAGQGLKEAYLINAIELANFRFGFYKGREIFSEVNGKVFEGMSAPEQRKFKDSLEAYSERYKILFFELAKKSKAMEIVDKGRVLKVLNEYGKSEKAQLSPSELTKEKILDIYYNPEKYGVDKFSVKKFKEELAKSISSSSSIEIINEVVGEHEINLNKMKLNESTISAIVNELDPSITMRERRRFRELLESSKGINGFLDAVNQLNIDPHEKARIKEKVLIAMALETTGQLHKYIKKEGKRNAAEAKIMDALNLSTESIKKLESEIGKQFDRERFYSDPKGYLTELYLNAKGENASEIRKAILDALSMHSGLYNEVINPSSGRKNNDFLNISKEWVIDWNFIKKPFSKDDFGGFMGKDVEFEKYAKKYYKKLDPKIRKEAKTRESLFLLLVSEAERVSKNRKKYKKMIEDLSEFSGLDKKTYGELKNELNKYGIDTEKFIEDYIANELERQGIKRDKIEELRKRGALFNGKTKTMFLERLAEIYKNPSLYLEKGVESNNDVIKSIIEKAVKVREKAFLSDISGYKTGEAFSREDYNTTMRKTALLEFLYNRFAGEVEFGYDMYKKYIATYDAAVLNANGKGRMIDGANHFHALTNMILSMRNYGLRYFGVDINNQEEVIKAFSEYKMEDIIKEMEKRNFSIYKEDLESTSWQRTKELGFVPYLPHEIADLSLLPEKYVNKVNENIKKDWNNSLHPSVSNKENYIKNSSLDEIKRVVHELDLSQKLTAQSAYPVNIDYAVVEGGMIRKFAPEDLTISQTDVVKIGNKWGREFNSYAAETLARMYENINRTPITPGTEGQRTIDILLKKANFISMLLSATKTADRFSQMRGHSVAIKLENIEEIARLLGAKTVNELIQKLNEGVVETRKIVKIIGVSGENLEITPRSIREALESIRSNEKIAGMKYNKKKMAEMIQQVEDHLEAGNLTLEDLAFLVRFDQRETSLSESFAAGIIGIEEKTRNPEILSKFLENLGLFELLIGIRDQYSKTKNYEDKQEIMKFLEKFEKKGEYIAAAKFAYELTDKSKDEYFIKNLKGLLFGSHIHIRQKLNRYGSEYMENVLRGSKMPFSNKFLRFAKGFMNGVLLKNMITYNGIPFGRGALAGLDAIGNLMTELTWQTYGKELLAEEGIFHASEMAKAINHKMLKNMTTNAAYRKFMKDIDNEITGRDLRISDMGNGFFSGLKEKLMGNIKKGTQDPFDIRLEYLSELVIDGSTITREMGLTYGGIDSSKRDGKIGAVFHIKSSLGSTEMFATLGVLGYSAPMHRTVSPFSSGLFISSLLMPLATAMGPAGALLALAGGYTLSGSIPGFIGRSLYRSGKSPELSKKLMRANIMHWNLLLASGTFYSIFTGSVLGLSTYSRHYMFPAAGDIKAAGFRESDFQSPKRSYATMIPRTLAAVKELYEKPLLYGAPLMAFLGASSLFGIGGGLGAIGLWKLSSALSKKSYGKKPARRFGINASERISKLLGSTEGIQLGSVDEIKYRRAASMIDFAGWYSHSIGTIGAGPVNPGQSYYDFYTGRYKTEPWIHHYISGDKVLRKTMIGVSSEDINRMYDMFSRYNTSTAYKALQSWKDVYGYGPTEAYMWWVMSPVFLGMWLGKRMQEYGSELSHVWKGAKYMGYTPKLSEKLNVGKQALTTLMYGIGAPLMITSTISPTNLLLGIGATIAGGAGTVKTARGIEEARNKIAMKEIEMMTEASIRRVKTKTEGDKKESSSEGDSKEPKPTYEERVKMSMARRKAPKTFKLGQYLKHTLKSYATRPGDKPIHLFTQRCPRCQSYKPIGGRCPVCGFNPRKDFRG